MWQAIKNFARLWWASETNVFNNFLDALLGLVVQIVFPVISLRMVYSTNSTLFSTFGFPILTISAAAMYDSFNRIIAAHYTKERDLEDVNSSTEFKVIESGYTVIYTKLVVRIVLHFITILAAFLLSNDPTSLHLRWIPYALLIFSGIHMFREMCSTLCTYMVRKFGTNNLSI